MWLQRDAKDFYYARIPLQKSDWILQTFSFHKNCHFNGVPCNGTEDQFWILNILQTLPLLSEQPQGWAGSDGVSETDGNPSPTSNSNWWSILEHTLLCLHLHRPFPRGLSLTVLIEKGSGLATGMGGTLGCPTCFSCALLITKLRCIHCWKCRKLQNKKNSKK